MTAGGARIRASVFKHSQFNHLAQLPGEDSWALVNFAYGTVSRLDAVQKAVFDIAPTLRPDVPLMRKWLRQGFVVDAAFDEVEAVRERVNRFREGFASGASKQ